MVMKRRATRRLVAVHRGRSAAWNDVARGKAVVAVGRQCPTFGWKPVACMPGEPSPLARKFRESSEKVQGGRAQPSCATIRRKQSAHIFGAVPVGGLGQVRRLVRGTPRKMGAFTGAARVCISHVMCRPAVCYTDAQGRGRVDERP